MLSLLIKVYVPPAAASPSTSAVDGGLVARIGVLGADARRPVTPRPLPPAEIPTRADPTAAAQVAAEKARWVDKKGGRGGRTPPLLSKWPRRRESKVGGC